MDSGFSEEITSELDDVIVVDQLVRNVPVSDIPLNTELKWDMS